MFTEHDLHPQITPPTPEEIAKPHIRTHTLSLTHTLAHTEIHTHSYNTHTADHPPYPGGDREGAAAHPGARDPGPDVPRYPC